MSILSEIDDYLRTKKPDIFSLVETKLNDSEDVPIGEGQYNVWRQNSNKKKVRWSNGVNKEGCDNGESEHRRYGRGVEGRVGNEKWKKKILGTHIHSIQDQCLGERRVRRHGERHMQMFKKYDRKQ